MKNVKRLKISLLLLIAFSNIFCGGNNHSDETQTGETVPASELIVQADNLYKARGDNLQKVKDGLQLLRRARVADGNNFDAAWKLAKFDYFLGHNTKDDETRDKAFKEGVTAGKTAIRMQPEKPDGYFWTGANLGGQAQVNILDGAANLPEIRQNMEKVVALNSAYEGGMAYVVLAQIELETRGMMGGSAEKAAALLEQALKLDKQNSFIYLYLAEAYLYLNRKPEARKMLDAVRNTPPSPDYLPERREAEEKATALEKRF